MSKLIIDTLKTKYFELAAKEKIGHTPELTKEIDELELEIRKAVAKADKKKLKNKSESGNPS
jgi:hypothetical protein